MADSALDALLQSSMTDGKFTAGEKNQLLQWLDDHGATLADLNGVRSRAFELAESAVDSLGAAAVFAWLKEVVKALAQRQSRLEKPGISADQIESALFVAPDQDCPGAILRAMRDCRQSLDIAVFTITDDRLSDGILDAKRRGVAVRILTDNEKMHDPGSDIARFEQAGIPVRIDSTAFHMHHKFAIFDDCRILTGSYNWTRGAAQNNEEHFIITNDPTLVTGLRRTFDDLWAKLA
ncbi:phospholipase D-like domain-containing protein [Tuwongella immobilis]|uniref:phospholipase D n=1 Tax=Tuwongella immobilis TaxID=692036 RepID=A0A6C2YML0_9BACT|nr:phospholipase D-like domain-containing protein [Tuwongella immobilis]VIP02830.1 phosphatidylserine phosphatidylglycerophosphate cardiolipin synthase-like protein : Endonuclease OS=Cystobacter violaceus Cb vi76 GN=Q664_02620 PE=4 SV=1: PLDc_2 [Tuwongella immobilis]VTS02578.1 phosphatidylserine phosphatidylglycerophosphate cardiolipin synthase-like protein : Endonuclease OS=Cystobacter violaceus Cb vi76 GN=Q664_02620 PE=4 SV=1: PLDc_2 [Tuwongella immobilis]